MKFFAITFATGISFLTLMVLDSIELQIKRYSSFDDFLEDVKNTANDLVDFVTKMQALFCPDQPVCSFKGDQDRRDVLRTFPEVLSVGNLIVKTENIHESVGICCLPCSCLDSCWQDNNCCPTKQLLSGNSTTDVVRRECITASARSQLPDHMFLMTTDCFENKPNVTFLENCRNPNTESYESFVPVTSLSTGNTYRNRACAICNNDDIDVIEWTSHAIIKMLIPYFGFSSSTPRIPDTFQETLAILGHSRCCDTIFIPPEVVNNSRCISRQATKEVYCDESRNGNTSSADWIKESCQSVFSPIKYKKHSIFYPNLFCAICHDAVYFTNQTHLSCSKGTERGFSGYITGLLYYMLGSDSSDMKKDLKSRCDCPYMFDPYMNFCRPSYCSFGEFSVGCTCIQPLQNLSGMPVLLTFDITSKSYGNMLSDNHLKKLNKSVTQAIHTTVAHISIDFSTILHQTNASSLHCLFIFIVRSNPGHDTKQTMKPFMRYLNKGYIFTDKIGNHWFFAKLTSNARICVDNDPVKKLTTIAAQDMKQPGIEFRAQSVDKALRVISEGSYQVLSRLLYCTQLQLNESEYYETTLGQIRVNVTGQPFLISDYYKISPTEVRICADDYLKWSDETQTSGEFASKSTYSSLLLSFAIIFSLT